MIDSILTVWDGESFMGGKRDFNIRSTNSGIDKNKLLENTGDIPYVTRSNLNNGIDMLSVKNKIMDLALTKEM